MLKLQEDCGTREFRSQHSRSQRCCNHIRQQRTHDCGKRTCVGAG